MNERKKISTNNFRIENNVILFSNTILQISNISQVSVDIPPYKKINFWSIIISIVGMLFAQVKYYEFIQNMGIFLTTGGIVYIISILIYNVTNTEKYLHIYLSSGNVYCILCNNLKFLKEVMEVIEYCINNHYAQEIRIDFDNCQLYNSPIIVGNENEVN